ncbi:MAG: DUF2804 domain-containing protein [Desulfobacterales bacterium]|nr:DUF2804 domain-containing protein [Desulfobacterales bacterium]
MTTPQNEITSAMDLLDENGRLKEAGWARKPLWRYDRSRIRAPWHRIKEWDYYAVLSGDYGLTLTLSDLSYCALVAVCWLDFKKRTFTQIESMRYLTCGDIGFPPSSESGDLHYEDSKMKIEVEIKGNQRVIGIDAPAFVSAQGARGLAAEIALDQDPAMDSMNIATSWEKNRRAFYYNRKINNMPATGSVVIGDHTYPFSPRSASACLDWGRGNWTYKNRWYWGSLSTMVEGKPFGLNLGYGFSDRTPATENMIFFDGVAHKLGQVTFHFNPADYMKPWTIDSDDGRLNIDFEPIVDRNSALNLFVIASIQHQVFGYMTGTAILDNGEEIKFDRVLGFAEDVFNKW